MSQASFALADNRVLRLQQLLAEAAPKPGEQDLRRWEWHYLDRLLRMDTEYKLDWGSATTEPRLRVWNYLTEDGRWFVRGRREGDGVVIDVIDSPTGKPVGRV